MPDKEKFHKSPMKLSLFFGKESGKTAIKMIKNKRSGHFFL